MKTNNKNPDKSLLNDSNIDTSSSRSSSANTKFKPGNKLGGRKKGSLNKASLALLELRKLGEEKAREVLEMVIQQALGGCLTSQKLLIDKVLPNAKAIAVPIFDLPKTDTLEGVLEANVLVTEKAALGELTWEEAQVIKSDFKHLAELIETVELIPQIQTMKAQLDKLSESRS